MEDEKLLKMSLIIACSGIFVLFGILEFSDEVIYNVEEVGVLEENSDVVVYGKVLSLVDGEKVASFDISEYKIVRQKALLFKDNNNSVGIESGDYIKLEGSMYNGNIIVDEIEIVE